MLVFRGRVRRGMGKHHNLVIPGRSELPSAPDDWPDKLEPGSLNVLINDDGWPPEFAGISFGNGAQKLDSRQFAPAFTIPHDKIAGNFGPTSKAPERGTAQVWRAMLRVPAANQARREWVLRRIGSTIKGQLEIVSAVRLRDAMGLSDGIAVEVEMEYGGVPGT